MRRKLFCVDTHTQGQPTRVVFGGLPVIPGNTILEKQSYLKEEWDDLRKSIVLEPRGHDNMFGALLLPPSSPEAHIGVIFMDGGGYLNMCGHGLIGSLTAALEVGVIRAEEGESTFVVEAPAGLITCRAVLEKDRVTSVSFTNVPSFLYQEDISVDVPAKLLLDAGWDASLEKDGMVSIAMDIAFGGSFFAMIPARKYKIPLVPENASSLIKLGSAIKDEVNKKTNVSHPYMDHIKSIDLVEFSQEPEEKGEAYKNAVVFGEGQLDRSPCGTGTCAKMAVLYKKKKMGVGDVLVHDSIINTRFYGKIEGVTRVEDYEAIIPEITSTAFVTGYNELIMDEKDPLHKGFKLE